MSTPFDRLKVLQQAVREIYGRKPALPEMLVLDTKRDPFNAGSPTDVAKADWFKGIFGESTGVHLRQIHYRLLASGDAVRADGTPYVNDKNSWDYLGDASRQARYLGRVNPADLIDRRNPTPNIFMAPSYREGPEWSFELARNSLDRIHTYLGNDFSDPLSVRTSVDGYFYEGAQQPYHVEVWAEKTTMNDVLLPICRNLGVNFVSGAGYQSVTAMIALLGRVERLDKPTRVLYISDFDKAGGNMPKQMARHMEFWTDHYGTDHDIRVEPIVMTAEQAANYPPHPETGAVELDAMEVLDPGRLEQIVQESAAQFRDFDLPGKVRKGGREARELVELEVKEAIAAETAEVAEIKGGAEEIYARYRARLEDLAGELDAELGPLDERLKVLQQAAREKLEALKLVLPPIPEGEVDDPADEGWLFDSRRDYLEQLAFYKGRGE